MPKRTKIAALLPYTGIGESPEKMLVQKSTPLQSLTETDLTLAELKIIDAFLARIDSHDDTRRTVCYEKGELEQLLGVTRLLKPDLEKRLRHLFQVVKIEDSEEPKGFTLVSLFERAAAVQNEDALWTITLTCTEAARKYVFNIEHLGYFSYLLRSVVNFTSRYSYILFLYLERERNHNRKSWEVPLEELKQLLQCTAATYEKYYRFNELVLSKCHREIHEYTNCHYSYEPVKKSRTVKAVRFTLEAQKDALDGQIAFFEPTEEQFDDNIEHLRNVCRKTANDEPEFSREQISGLLQIILTMPDAKLPNDRLLPDDIDVRRQSYLGIRYDDLCRASEKKPIKNRYNYFLKMIKEDAGIK